ncbi:minor tail protein [Arthrobacter phage Emotion]|uniref:Minor tail protein n=1 Tax=Arthrobacter phage Emotion TaxID=3038361 RepID=A0AA49EQY8_9CAUD|nr:minor tail protein [Arthrobacter phage Emotion]
MAEGDFDLNGYKMGLGYDVVVESFDPGSAEWITQDAVAPVGGRRNFGADYASGPTWVLDLATDTHDAASARAALAGAARAWRPSGLATPGYEAILKYTIGGETRRVYGRPRKFAPIANGVSASGVMLATAEFVTSEAFTHAEEARSLTVGLVPVESGGFTSPLISPITTVAGSQRQGLIDDVGGDAPAPMTITIQGPVSGPKVSSSGWYFSLPSLSLAYDQSVTIDTRKGTVRRNDGANLGGLLSRGSTRLVDARLKTGAVEFIYSGTDQTATSTATVTWRPTYHAL